MSSLVIIALCTCRCRPAPETAASSHPSPSLSPLRAPSRPARRAAVPPCPPLRPRPGPRCSARGCRRAPSRARAPSCPDPVRSPGPASAESLQPRRRARRSSAQERAAGEIRRKDGAGRREKGGRVRGGPCAQKRARARTHADASALEAVEVRCDVVARRVGTKGEGLVVHCRSKGSARRGEGEEDEPKLRTSHSCMRIRVSRRYVSRARKV